MPPIGSSRCPASQSRARIAVGPERCSSVSRSSTFLPSAGEAMHIASSARSRRSRELSGRGAAACPWAAPSAGPLRGVGALVPAPSPGAADIRR